MSDAIIKEKTGCTWERWVKSLDYHGAARDVASRYRDAHRTRNTRSPSWWTQTVAVGYERIKGLRARGQQRDGTYGATKSRTFNVPVTELFDAWMDASVRKRWLDGASVKVRTATAPKIDAARLDGRQHHRRRVHVQGQIEERGRARALEAARTATR